MISVLRAYTSDNDYVFDIDFDENEVFSMFSDINAISNQYNSVYPVVCGDFELLDSEKIKEDIRSHLINSIHADLSRIDEILNDEIWEHEVADTMYQALENNIIKSFDNTTDKEIRQAHNLEKMYKAGAFNVKA